MLDNADDVFDFNSGSYGVESLTGFSLRIDVVDEALGGQDAGQIVVDTLVRDHVLYVEISNTLDTDAYSGLKRYQVLQADGKPLPTWVRQANNGTLLAEVPANMPAMKLMIIAEFNDGASIEHRVDIQTSSGEVQPIADSAADYIPTFSEQLRQSSQSDLDLLKKLDRDLDVTPGDESVE